ncbi:MAG: hypothetical protein ACLS9K_12055 [Lachnospira eligens]
MLYIATRKLSYAGAGLLAGAGASVIAYKLFAHVRGELLYGVIRGNILILAVSDMSVTFCNWYGIMVWIWIMSGYADKIL